MNHDQQRPDAQEQQLLAHFREHAGGEPSAELDALILGAARAELTKEPRPGPAQRLHNWLFGGGRQRWSLALAGLACVGVGVSLTWRTLERTPPVFDAPSEVLMAPTMRSAAPAAPMADAMPAPQARERQGLSEAPAKKALEAEVAVEALSSYEDLAVGAAAAAPPAELARKTGEAEFARQLQRLSKLRRDGWQEEADQLLLQLMRDYPQRNIELELRALELQAQ
jgi:hypothetical protein